MPIQFDKFDQSKIDRLKSHLESLAAKGAAKFYEIFVDGLKAVPKTDEPKEFDGYEDYMTPETSQVKVVIYCSGASPRNDQYVFSMKAKTNEEALDMGLNGIAMRGFTTKQLETLRTRRDQKNAYELEIKDLNAEIKDLYKELDEKDSYISQLENAIEQAKANGNKIGGFHAGEILGVALDGLLKKHARKIEEFSGLDGLAGLLESGEKTPEQTTQTETEVTVKKKSQEESGEQNSTLSEQDKNFLALFREIAKHFSQTEMDQVIEIIHNLSIDKSKIAEVLQIMKLEAPEETETNTNQK